MATSSEQLPLPTLPATPVRRTDVKTSFYLPPRLLREAKVCAAAHGVSLRTVLVNALRDYVARHGAGGRAA